MRALMHYISDCDKKIDLFLPESFEWLILKSKIFERQTNVQSVLANPIDFIESRDYFSWERFFTHLLVDESKDKTNLRYPANKTKLPSGYLSDSNMESIMDAMM